MNRFLYSLSLIISCLLHSSLFYAQSDDPMKFGQVSPKDLKMEVYEADTTAAAVVLCDFGNASVEEIGSGYDLFWTHHKRIKILKKEGFQQANIIIPFYSYKDREIFRLEKATIHLPNGKQLSVAPNEVTEERINNYYSLAKFTFPQVTEGCIIEYIYNIRSSYIYELREWYFQHEIPVVHSEIRVNFPQFVDYIFLFQGNEGMTPVKDSDGNTTYKGKNGNFTFSARKFIVEDAPAMKEEAYITTMDDYRARIRFQLSDIAHRNGNVEKVMGDWPRLQKDIAEHPQFGSQMLKKAHYKKITEQLLPQIAVLNTDKEKIKFFYSYLTTHIRWNENYSLFTHDKKLNEIFEQGEANSAEINMMLFVLLKEAGIKAAPVILSTRQHGKMIMEHPILDQFNHMIVLTELEGKPVVLDATDPLRPIGYPSIQALNGVGLKLDFESDKPTWINIPPPRDGADVISFNLNLDAEGTLTGSMVTAHKGYNAIPERRGAADDHGKKLWQGRLTKSFPEAVVLNAKSGNLQLLETTYYDTLDISIPNAAQVSGDRIYLSPVLYSEYNENPFKLKERLYPVDLAFPFLEQVTLNLQIPGNYTVESLPKMVMSSAPNGGASYFFSSSDKGSGKIQLSSSLNISKQKFLSTEYQDLKAIFEAMIQKKEEMLVLKKK